MLSEYAFALFGAGKGLVSACGCPGIQCPGHALLCEPLLLSGALGNWGQQLATGVWNVLWPFTFNIPTVGAHRKLES